MRATAVTQGWDGYQKKSQHRKLTLEKKILPFMLKIEPAAFQNESSALPVIIACHYLCFTVSLFVPQG